jgi:hypothetical protein
VTLGTFFNGNTQVFRTILDGLADQPVDVVVTVGGDQDPAELEPAPGNAKIERFVAQAELLPTCSVIVHHGGAGTTFGALAHGVPQVIVPQGADNYDNAAMCERAGMALVLRPDEFTAKAVAGSVSALLVEARFVQRDAPPMRSPRWLTPPMSPTGCAPTAASQSCGGAAKFRLTCRYYPMPAVGFFDPPFLLVKARWCETSPLTTR